MPDETPDWMPAPRPRAAMAKLDEFSFVSRTLASNGVTNTLTFTGTLLTDYPGTGKTDQIGFGYCDVHPNKTLGGTIASIERPRATACRAWRSCRTRAAASAGCPCNRSAPDAAARRASPPRRVAKPCGSSVARSSFRRRGPGFADGSAG